MDEQKQPTGYGEAQQPNPEQSTPAPRDSLAASDLGAEYGAPRQEQPPQGFGAPPPPAPSSQDDLTQALPANQRQTPFGAGQPAAPQPQSSAWGGPDTPAAIPPSLSGQRPAEGEPIQPAAIYPGGQGGGEGTQPPYAAGGAFGPTDPAARSRRGLGVGLVALALASALIGGVVGGVIVHETNKPKTVASSLASGTNGQNADSQPPAPATGNIEWVAQHVSPSVVSIGIPVSGGQVTGSGIVLSSDGEIVTNNHVVVASVDSGNPITVTFSNGQTATAKIIGRDQLSDLAVIKAQNVSGLTPAVLGDSNNLVVGQQVVAIGSPVGLANTVTNGIVSALNRPVNTTASLQQEQQQEQGNGGLNPFGGGSGNQQPSNGGAQQTVIDAIQTDAAINPGNSGGALVDMDGRVVGINAAIASVDQSNSSSGGESGSIGIGFAIPISEAKPIISELAAGKPVARAELKVTVQDSSTGTPGGQISGVTANGPAAKAGLQVGDVVTKVNSRIISDSDGLVAAIRAYQPGDQVTITYVRGGSTHTTTVTLGSSLS
jgi:putative serine protease PepD